MYGVSGLVVQPYNNIQTTGILRGIVPGVLKATTGFIIKPFVGIIDLVSKTSEGLKNTATHFDDKPVEQKVRPPRVVYAKH